MLSILRFRILTLMISIAGVCLLISLTVRETTTITEPYCAPLMGAARHPPPFDPKAKPRVGGSFGLRNHASLEISHVGIAVDASAALILIATIAFISELTIRRVSSK